MPKRFVLSAPSILVASVLVAGALAAQEVPRLAPAPELPAKRRAESNKAAERWLEQIKAADALLREGKVGEARKEIDGVLRQISNRLEGGRAAGTLVGPAILVRSLARAAQGETEEAAYDWAMVRSLDPDSSHPDLAPYRIPPEALPLAELEERWKKAEEDQARMDSAAPAPAAPTASAPVERPVKISGRSPEYPEAWLRGCLGGSAVIDGSIDIEGRVRIPRVREGSVPAAYAAMEALRSWRFRPAHQGKEPVPVLYTLSANFDRRGCIPGLPRH